MHGERTPLPVLKTLDDDKIKIKRSKTIDQDSVGSAAAVTTRRPATASLKCASRRDTMSGADRTRMINSQLSPAEIEYTMQVTRPMKKSELVDGANWVEKFIRDKVEKPNPKLRRSNVVNDLTNGKPAVLNRSMTTYSVIKPQKHPERTLSLERTSSMSNPVFNEKLVPLIQIENNNSSNTMENCEDSDYVSATSFNKKTNEKESEPVHEFEDKAQTESFLSDEMAESTDSFYDKAMMDRRQLTHSAPSGTTQNKAKLVPIARKHHEDPGHRPKSRHVQIVEPDVDSKNDDQVPWEPVNDQQEEESERLEELLNNDVEINKDNLHETMLLLRSKLRQINQEEMQSKNKTISEMRKADFAKTESQKKVAEKTAKEKKQEAENDKTKSIRRKQHTIVSRSMDVDKWVEVHKRRNTNTAVHLIKKNVKLTKKAQDQMSILNKKLEEVKLSNLKDQFLEDNDPSKSRSIRTLSEMTVLDKVENRLKRQLMEKLRILRKLESQNEFNQIVDKIKGFLDDIEEFKCENNVINDYFSNYSNNKLQTNFYNSISNSSRSLSTSNEITRYNPIKLYELILAN